MCVSFNLLTFFLFCSNRGQCLSEHIPMKYKAKQNTSATLVPKVKHFSLIQQYPHANMHLYVVLLNDIISQCPPRKSFASKALIMALILYPLMFWYEKTCLGRVLIICITISIIYLNKWIRPRVIQ